MDVVYVRTKLQALIASALIDKGIVSPKFELVEVYLADPETEYPPVSGSYAPLRAKASRVNQDVAQRSFLRSFLRALDSLMMARLSGGRVFNANIAEYPFALALRLIPGARFRSFDDGFANVSPGQSAYHGSTPIEGSSLKRRLLRWLFPNGASALARGRIERHFTIYPGLPNVAPADRLERVTIHWRDHLSARDLEKLSRDIRTIIIGSRYDEWPQAMGLREKVAAADHDPAQTIYVVHPREDDPPLEHIALRFDGPAEGIVDHLAQRGPVTVIHQDSSVALSFADDPRVTLVNLAPPDWTLKQIEDGLRNQASSQ